MSKNTNRTTIGHPVFFNDIQDVSNEEAQQLYAKVLVLQRQFREGCGVMPARRRGAGMGAFGPFVTVLRIS